MAEEYLAKETTTTTNLGDMVVDYFSGHKFTRDGFEDTTTSHKYDFTSRTFPAELGEDAYSAHYMVINIMAAQPPLGMGGRGDNRFTTLTNAIGVRDQNLQRDVSGGGGASGPRPRFTRRIEQSIALFMPNNIEFNSQNEYSDVSLTDLVAAGANRVAGALPIVGGTAEKVSNLIGQGIAKGAELQGTPINPRIEVLYKNTPMRRFLFDFMCVPESQEDARNLREIITTLRYHAAPQVNDVFSGLMFISPSEFDISFWHQGVQNNKIPKISSCTLEKIDIQYTPSGVWSAHMDGEPIGARMQLSFHETEIISKQRVEDGF